MTSNLIRVVLGTGVAVFVMLRGPVIAEAQPSAKTTSPSAANQQVAKKLVDDGIAAMNAKSYDKAIELYLKAYALVPHPALLYDIGLAYKLAGRFDQAVTFYQHYLAIAPNGPQAKVARAALAEILTSSTVPESVTTGEHDSSSKPTDAGKVVGPKVTAQDRRQGSSGSQDITELTADPPGKSDEETPSKHNMESPTSGDSGAAVAGGTLMAGELAKVYVGVVGGTSFGYLTGKTEFENTVDNCCIGHSLFVSAAELGYYVNPQFSLGMAVRLGFPVGANIDGHSTLALAGFVRVRYALHSSGEGVRVIGQLGAGVLRNTVKLEDSVDGMDTDIVAQGPLLLSGGIGYSRRIYGKISFVADLLALAGIAVVKEFGSAPNLNSGISADVSLGLAVGF